MPEFYFFFNIKVFLEFKFQIYAYTQLKSKNLKNRKISSRVVRNSTQRPQ